MRYTFEWDPSKASKNLGKHRVPFERAAEVFLDPLAISVVDEPHSEKEERWVTMGQDARGTLLVVIHTFRESTEQECKIRLISVRRATRQEATQYRESAL